jgi:ABC-type polysaccharide/polyol phosphate transport system ATPase subunit
VKRSTGNFPSSEIVAFCKLGEYLDLPVRTYSTGMVARLGFTIATDRPGYSAPG